MNETRTRIELTIDSDRARGVLRVVGEFDRLHVSRFERVAADAHVGLSEFVVDLRRTTIIDSAALGALVRLRRSIADADGTLVVLVSRTFQVTVMRVGGLFEYLGVEVVDDSG